MQTCSICEKAIYGHDGFKELLVCGSCALTKREENKPGKVKVKTQAQIRLDLAKVLTSKVQKKESVMSDSVVKSNYARSKTILLDGRYPLSFDATGKAVLPGKLREAFDREMVVRPGRYWYADSEVAVVTVASPVPAASQLPVQEEIQEQDKEVEVVELDLEEESSTVPVGLELSFEEEAQKPSAASYKKGKQKKK